MTKVIYSQRTSGYQNIKLGFGLGSLWHYGCVITSFSQGLLRFGIKYTPKEMNELLKSQNLFTGQTENLMDNTNIHKLPFIESYQRINTFTMTQLTELLKTHVVNAEVSPIPIGGTGQHFVSVDGVEGANAIIIDPWFGDRIKVASRYGKYGNILSLRVYKVKVGAGSPPDMSKELQACMADRSRFWEERDAALDQVGKLKKDLEDQKNDTEVWRSSHSKVKNDYDDFLKWCVEQTKPKYVPGISDRELAEFGINNLVISESNLQKSLKSKETELSQKESAWERERSELKQDINQLEKEVNNVVEKYETEIQALRKRIEQLKQGIDDSNEDKEEINSIKAFLEAIRKFIFRK